MSGDTHPMLRWAELHGMSVPQLAVAAGCSEWHLRNILAGRKTASLGLAKKLTDLSGRVVPMDAFLSEARA